jgi:integrase
MSQRITNRTVNALRPPASGNRVVWDEEVTGFGVRITKAGAVSFVLRYVQAGRERRITVGKHPDLTVTAAREEATKMRGAIARGHDPLGEREAERRTPAMKAVCERYIADHLATHNRPTTQKEFARIVEKNILPALGSHKAHAIARKDVVALHHSMRATPRQANLTLAVLSKIFSLAELWGFRPDHSNPCRHVQRYAERKRVRFLSERELAALGAVLDRAESDKSEHAPVLDAIRLLALTGCRLGEILTLRWEHVNCQTGVLRLPDAKAGARDHAIGASTILLLEALERAERSPWVLTRPATGSAQRAPRGRQRGDADEPAPLTTAMIEKAWGRLKERATLDLWREADDGRLRDLLTRLDAEAVGEDGAKVTVARVTAEAAAERIDLPPGLMDARLHDLRHTVGTYAGQTGASAFLVQHKLGHKTISMTARYVNRDADPLRALSDLVEGRIAGAMSGRKGDVVPLRRPQAG